MSSQSCPVEQIIMGSIGHDYGPLVMGVGKEDNAVQFPWACADLDSSQDSVGNEGMGKSVPRAEI